MQTKFNKDYWENKYIQQNTGWDIGSVSTPLKNYIDQLTNKQLKILIPGAGNGHEVAYLASKGFSDVTVVDIAQTPLKNIQKNIPDFPKENLIQQNFFDHQNQYDLIIEQTFFCALDPILREKYAKKMKRLLKPKGKLVGLLFNFELTPDGPPFGGSLNEYLSLFTPLFEIKVLENCYNSIKPRENREFFIIFENK